MPLKTLENFFRTTISVACGNATGKIYLVNLPTNAPGYLVISPGNSTKREIVEYNSKGTDVIGNYIFANTRGIGGTLAQSHEVGESVRGNLVAEHYNEIGTDLNNSVKKTGDETIAGIKTFTSIPVLPNTNPTTDNQAARKKYVDDIAVSGAPDASSTVKGISKLTVNPATPTNPIAVGSNDPILNNIPSSLPVPITEGGTGATTAANARTNLDVPKKGDEIEFIQSFTYGETIGINDAVFLAYGANNYSLVKIDAGDLETADVYGVNWFSQSFITSAKVRKITKVAIKGRRLSDPPGDMTVSIRNTEVDGKPTGADLVSKSLPASTFPTTSGAWQEFIFDTPLTVTPNTKYAIVFRVPDGDAGNYVRWNTHNTDLYADGERSVSANSGSTWGSPNATDRGIEVWETRTEEGKIYKTSALYGNESIQNFIGFAKEAGVLDEIKKVQTGSKVSGFAGLTIGAEYFLSNTTGAISATPGTYVKEIGIAISLTEIFIRAVKRLGKWEIKALNTIYQAEIDGFVVVGGGSESHGVRIITDSSSSPTTTRIYDYDPYTTARDTGMCPVRKGDYWKVTLDTGSVVVYWMPLV